MVKETPKEQVMRTLEEWFRVNGSYKIHEDLSVSVQGTVTPLNRSRMFPDRKLPVQFHTVTNMYVDNMDLISCEGMPHTVEKIWLNHNPIQSLEGGPTHVGEYFNITFTQLANLDHFPDHTGAVSLDYDAQMPLLRCLNADKIYWPNMFKTPPQQLQDIFNKYAGEGKKAMLNCALELKKAGFAGNARW